MVAEKRVPHVRQQSIKRQTMERLICNRLEWTEEQYNQFQLDAGCDFVNYIMDALDPDQRRLITTSSLFWGWWKNQWFSRDQAVYSWVKLEAHNYQYVHTLNLRDCQATINSFWNLVADMMQEGRKKLLTEAGKGVANER
jgi:hypothetical protein